MAAMLKTEEAYRQGLLFYYKSWAPLETTVAQADYDFPPAMASRYRLRRLRDDICQLDVDSVFTEGLAKCPRIESQEDLVGMLYVMEGSTLGGQIVARMLREKLGIEGDSGGGYFAAHGDATAMRWREFATWARANVHTPDAAAAAVDKAREVFQFITYPDGA